jgi:hypothetical protein
VCHFHASSHSFLPAASATLDDPTVPATGVVDCSTEANCKKTCAHGGFASCADGVYYCCDPNAKCGKSHKCLSNKGLNSCACDGPPAYGDGEMLVESSSVYRQGTVGGTSAFPMVETKTEFRCVLCVVY